MFCTDVLDVYGIDIMYHGLRNFPFGKIYRLFESFYDAGIYLVHHLSLLRTKIAIHQTMVAKSH